MEVEREIVENEVHFGLICNLLSELSPGCLGKGPLNEFVLLN